MTSVYKLRRQPAVFDLARCHVACASGTRDLKVGSPVRYMSPGRAREAGLQCTSLSLVLSGPRARRNPPDFQPA